MPPTVVRNVIDCAMSSGAVDSFSSGVLAMIGGTTRPTQLSIGMVLFENGLVNAM